MPTGQESLCRNMISNKGISYYNTLGITNEKELHLYNTGTAIVYPFTEFAVTRFVPFD